jgi:hypothetical protein
MVDRGSTALVSRGKREMKVMFKLGGFLTALIFSINF